MSNAEKCLQACKQSLRDNEYNLRKIKGVKLSHSDVETAILYAETIQRHGTYQGLLMKPHGGVADLLGKFGLLEA